MHSRPLRVAIFLAPIMFPVYHFICGRVAQTIDQPIDLIIGRSYEQLTTGELDAAFVCGLPYAKLTQDGECPIEPLVAPVLAGHRYGNRPIYFSDVIVHRASRHKCFDDLRGCIWAYNEPHSQSGFGITRWSLARRGESFAFFGRLVETNFHERSIDAVAAGEVDASAIDSQVLAVALRQRPDLASQLRVIATLGPSPIQPFVVARELPRSVVDRVRDAMLSLGRDPESRAELAAGFVRQFVPVTDADYDAIRDMQRVSEVVCRTRSALTALAPQID